MMTCTLNGGHDMVNDGRDLEAGRRMQGRTLDLFLFPVCEHVSRVLPRDYAVMCLHLSYLQYRTIIKENFHNFT